MARVLSSNQSRGALERCAAIAIGGLGAVIACIVIAACGATSPIVSGALVVPTATPLLPVTIQVAYTISGTASLNISGSTLPNARIAVSKGPPVAIATAAANASGNFVVHLTGIDLGMTTYDLLALSPGHGETITQFTVTRKS
jgi:hypothetical protein